MLNAALVSFAVFSPDHGATAGKIAGALAATLLPYSVVGPFVGVVIDRVSRRQVLVLANLLRAAVLCGLAALVAAGHSGLDFDLVALIAFSVGRFVLATLSTGLPLVVPSSRLVPANSLSTTSGGVATLVGAAVVAGLRAVVGGHDGKVALLVLLAAAAYVAASTVARALGRDEIGPLLRGRHTPVREELASVLHDTADGARGIWRTRPARDALAALSLQRFAYGFSIVAAIVVYRNYFHSGLGGLALATAFAGIGSVLAAVSTPRGTRRLGTGRWMVAAYLLAACAELAFGLPYTEPAFAAASLVIGFTVQATKICTDSIVQGTVPDRLRGRAFSVYDMLFNVTYVAAAQLARLLPFSGRSRPATVATALAYAGAAVVYVLLRRLDRKGAEQRTDAAERPAERTVDTADHDPDRRGTTPRMTSP